MSKKKSSYSYFDEEEDYDEKINDDKSSSSEDEVEDEVEVEEEVEINQDDEEEDEDEDEEDEMSDEDEEDEDQIGGADDVGDIEVDEDGNPISLKQKKTRKIVINKSYLKTNDDDNEDEDEDEDEDGELYLKKFDKEINDNYIVNFHPECALQNYDEIFAMTKIVRDENGIIMDDLHRTIPYLTKYEKARILGQRAKQINAGATPFVKIPENVIDGYLIAELELQQKRIPFIIRRPLPNGGSEYWNLKDLENISF